MKLKYCSKCGQFKPLSAFSRNRSRKDGYRYWCKDCTRVWEKQSRLRCKKQRRVYQQAYNLKNKEKARRYYLRKVYDLSIEQYNLLLRQQKYRCAICRKPQLTLLQRLNVDHDHTTGRVRGLLCGNCNQMLGTAKDSPAILRKGARYLKQAEKKRCLNA